MNKNRNPNTIQIKIVDIHFKIHSHPYYHRLINERNKVGKSPYKTNDKDSNTGALQGIPDQVTVGGHGLDNRPVDFAPKTSKDRLVPSWVDPYHLRGFFAVCDSWCGFWFQFFGFSWIVVYLFFL